MMNRIILVQILLISLWSCKQKVDCKTEKEVIVSGQVKDYDKQKDGINLYVYRICQEREVITSKLDSLGNFKFKFKTFVPLETELVYNTGLTVLAHPGDSLHIEFYGDQNLPQTLENLKFSGSSEKLNSDITAFKKMLYTDYVALNKVDYSTAQMIYGIPDYELYLDTMQQGFDNFIKLFIQKNSPCNEAIGWGNFYLKQLIFDAMISYSFLPDFNNNSNPRYLNFPVSFYDRFLDVTPIDYSLFLNSKDLPRFINAYSKFYTYLNLVADEANKKNKAEQGYIADVPMNDSIEFAGLIKYTPDVLLRQLIFTDKFAKQLDALKIESYENNREFISQIVTESYLTMILNDKYSFIKEKLDNPQIASDAILNKLGNSSAKAIMDSILLSNKGKIIYIDCWADYCAPCLAEMPNSKELEGKLKEKDVSFVYVCLSSDEKQWKALLDKFQLSGQHYFLDNMQSEEWRNSFNITGVPYYFLIDNNGTIVENGSYLRPNVAEEKIEKLMN